MFAQDIYNKKLDMEADNIRISSNNTYFTGASDNRTSLISVTPWCDRLINYNFAFRDSNLCTVAGINGCTIPNINEEEKQKIVLNNVCDELEKINVYTSPSKFAIYTPNQDYLSIINLSQVETENLKQEFKDFLFMPYCVDKSKYTDEISRNLNDNACSCMRSEKQISERRLLFSLLMGIQELTQKIKILEQK